jgi:tRNA A-37 threonylcarbamoyl transferase component Bud32
MYRLGFKGCFPILWNQDSTKAQRHFFMTTSVLPTEEPTTGGLSPRVPIPKKWLGFVRGVWGTVVLYCFTLFFAGILTRHQSLVEVTPEELLALNRLGISPEFQAYWLLIVEIIFMLGFSIVGILIFFQKSNDLAIVTTSLLLVSFGTSNLNVITSLATVYPLMDFPTRIAKFISWSWMLPLLYTFPNGKFTPKWTRWLTLVWVGTNLAWLINPDLPNNPTKRGMLTQPFWFYFYMAWFFSGVLSQVYRYRRSESLTQKQQTKWIVFGFGIAVGGTFLEELPAMINPELMNTATPEGVIYHLVSFALFVLFLISIPITLGFSIRRNRLWDIDFVINRSLVYGAATSLLALVFAGIFFLLQNIFERVTGGQQPTIAVVASTLTITGLFQPVRSRLQIFIDRNLYGIHISYKKKPFIGLSRDYAYYSEQIELDEYRILEPIGRGGMAEIYKGRHKNQDMEVAIKILAPRNPADEESFKLRFAREAETAASLKHPNIVEVYDYFESDEICYIVMEYIPGLNLSELIKQTGPLEIKVVQTLVWDIAKALDYAHNKGIVHRDIKPSNVLLRPVQRLGESFHEPILTDFGIAKITASVTQITQTEIIGTIDYIAPEQIQAASNVDRRADIYALGIMTFQMLTGRLPFPTRNPGATLIGHLQHPPPNPQKFHPYIPDHIAYAIKKALEKEPTNRYPSAGDFAEAIQ